MERGYRSFTKYCQPLLMRRLQNRRGYCRFLGCDYFCNIRCHFLDFPIAL